MNRIAIAIVILAGSLMAAAGTIAESLPNARRFSIVDEAGLLVVAIGMLMLLAEVIPFRSLVMRPIRWVLSIPTIDWAIHTLSGKLGLHSKSKSLRAWQIAATKSSM